LVRKATGRIVTIGSIAGKASAPIQGPYSISKFAVEAFNDSLRGELEPFGIHVSLVEPGPIETPMLQGVKKKADEVIAELPDHGKEWYRDQIETISGYFHQMEQRALPPQAVADVVTHALEANRPKTRYLVTQDAKMTAFMKWLLPDRAFDAMGRRMMKS
jgi:short-subunit dehydrogenase